ncbi:SAM-dependent methyltransferase [Clostridium beijerinckii]|jgi:cyclopropane-fatty-acyl-phospholipid synthase (EC 2.1.1.79)|uniref:Cyclopropane-fatty-acyl-phospholipid synthase n=1 Tax=Clostridium beijerinckii (strain ATCC 51743 / NCIMB 8052) TaxID=290402 RepID=A6M3C9_CLOB8|nr:cyclopropane-fatty-acyl-phospholipid synthase family protein [Clostridium beijerinckii]ABR37109.1 Cyclopropane-fatty-acyl-phospholipid synthase [Clostridium beijerinckii NCIMB 8052]AIU02116.1 cyclopropane-fatty-acyl-phospholipid synthase [Clostridium beijerinckii ATCC 35702]NRT21803.1 cyclopropane-fatty-acyl-phospholipid synthase [Clostridium beijerinckii]NRT65691.1 cyclopropane-fatty-acyl-phospholipid synthase [Clostridium beijerinckii]NRT82796.1 cyclopropane-fatty-acyl-phospholipid syntha
MIIDKIFYKTLFKNLFSDTFELKLWDGSSEIYGEGNPEFKIIFNEPIPKADIIKDPSLTFGEAYMTKKIDIEGSIQKVIESLYNNQESFLSNSDKYANLLRMATNSIKNSKKNIEFHYDIGNDFYKLWLDDTMTYSCGYFKSKSDSLTQAQKNKVEHILKKLNLKEGETLLDIGCGWGELIISAAKKYKVKAMGITLSSEQLAKVKERIKSEGLEDLIEVELVDYRELKNRTFDKIVSVGMLEHVGQDHLAEYFSNVNNLLNDKGVSLLHCITSTEVGGNNTWIDKYIFPGGYVPAVRELINCMSDERFTLIDAENLRLHYGRTLEHWAKNFENALPEIRKTKDETFIRMWRLYLNACAASFNSGNISIHQFVFNKGVNNDLPWTREYMYK